MKKIKQKPYSEIAEKALISCLLIDNSSYDQISHFKLTKNDFYIPNNGLIFDAILDLILSGQAADYVTLCSTLKDRGELEQIGGEASVVDIFEDQISAINISTYAQIVKDKATLREIMRKSSQIIDLSSNWEGKLDDFILEIEKSFFGITQNSKQNTLIKLNESLKKNIQHMEDKSRVVGGLDGISTGYQELDDLVLGMKPGQLFILAARPAMGKTALALNIAQNVCRSTMNPVAVFSLEMVAEELSMRLITQSAKVDSKRIRQKNFLETDIRKIGKAIQELSQLPLYINEGSGTTVSDIRSLCRKLKSEEDLGLIVIDYLQLLTPLDKRIPREQQVSEMSRSLKEMSQELRCPIIVLSQLNRGVENRDDKRPRSADLRESGSLEQDADGIWFVYRDEQYNKDSKDKGIAEIIISKNRNGETGKARLAFVGAHTSFENLKE